MFWRVLYILISFLSSCYSFIILSKSKQRTINRMSSCSSTNTTSQKKKALYPFQEARKIARNYGFESREEFLEYSCPGAYQLPKNPEEVWEAEWKGWENFLGICFDFESGREIARKLELKTQEEYIKLFDEKQINDDDPASRLPYRPDLKYKADWLGWDDWLLSD